MAKKAKKEAMPPVKEEGKAVASKAKRNRRTPTAKPAAGTTGQAKQAQTS
jgi:hypothetical protein